MDFKIIVLCGNCRCNFELRPKFIAQRPNLACPCCGAVIPEDVAKKLSNASALLDEVPDTILEDGKPDDFFNSLFPKFRFQIQKYDEITDSLVSHRS